MKKVISCVLALLLLLSVAGCGTGPAESTSQATTDPLPSEYLEPVEPVTVENPITSIFLSLNSGEGEYRYLSAYDDQTGGAYVELGGTVRKISSMDLAVLHGITDTLNKSGLIGLVGKDVYADGVQSGSFFAEYTDGTSASAGFTGTIPQEFIDGYDAMEYYFLRLMRDVPEYVPEPLIEGEIDSVLLDEMKQVLAGSGIKELDSFLLSAVAKDETMAFALGLEDGTHVEAAVSCSPMIQPNAYSFVIVRVDSTDQISAVRDDFAANLNWAKWVCVSANNALIAQKGDLVLCLMGSGSAFNSTVRGIEKCGWENPKTYQP